MKCFYYHPISAVKIHYQLKKHGSEYYYTQHTLITHVNTHTCLNIQHTYMPHMHTHHTYTAPYSHTSYTHTTHVCMYVTQMHAHLSQCTYI